MPTLAKYFKGNNKLPCTKCSSFLQSINSEQTNPQSQLWARSAACSCHRKHILKAWNRLELQILLSSFTYCSYHSQPKESAYQNVIFFLHGAHSKSFATLPADKPCGPQRFIQSCTKPTLLLHGPAATPRIATEFTLSRSEGAIPGSQWFTSHISKTPTQ